MAKTTTCAFCGKELTTGFFKGDAFSVSVGSHTAVCCEHCHDQYSKDLTRIEKRLKIKLNNYAAANRTRKLDSSFVADAIRRYLEEEKEQIARCGTITDATDLGYFVVDEEKGYFAIREFEFGRDATTGETLRNMKRAEEVGDVWFCKDDITHLEYATTLVGHSVGLFATAYTFQIRLNNEKVVTYKPCITRATFLGKGLFPHSQRKRAIEQCAAALTLLKDTIGAEIPVTSVKRLV